MSNSTNLSLFRQTILSYSLRAKMLPVSLYWAQSVEKALKRVRYSQLLCCFLQCCSAHYREIADQAVWEALWTLKMSKYQFFFRARTRWGSFQRSPTDQTGYRTTLPRWSKSPRSATVQIQSKTFNRRVSSELLVTGPARNPHFQTYASDQRLCTTNNNLRTITT